MNDRQGLSVNIVALDEFDDVDRLLLALAAEEEVVLLSMDRSGRMAEIARSHDRVAIEVEQVPVAESVRNVGFDQSRGEWVIWFDPDESFDADEFAALKLFLQGVSPSVDRVTVPFGTRGLTGRELRHGDYRQLSHGVRCIRRGVARFDEVVVQPHQSPKGPGEIAMFDRGRALLLDRPFRTIDQTMEKLVRYANSSHGERRTPVGAVLEFLRAIVRDRAWKDGADGVHFHAFLLVGALLSSANTADLTQPFMPNSRLERIVVSRWFAFLVDGSARVFGAPKRVTRRIRQR